MLFFSVSVLNNYAFGYNISVPVHIILRSGGSMTTLVIGYIWGKKYSRLQVFSVLLLTAGCVLSALGDSKGMVRTPLPFHSIPFPSWAADCPLQGETEGSMARFLTGLTILFVAQVLSAFMGLYIEATYTKYGNNYREGLFYTVRASLLQANISKANTASSMRSRCRSSCSCGDRSNRSSCGSWIRSPSRRRHSSRPRPTRPSCRCRARCCSSC